MRGRSINGCASFRASVEGAYYGEQVAAAELQGRVGHFPAGAPLPYNYGQTAKTKDPGLAERSRGLRLPTKVSAI